MFIKLRFYVTKLRKASLYFLVVKHDDKYIYIYIYIYISYVNPFIPKVPCLYFSDVFRRWREGALGTNGLISMSLFESG